MKVPAFLLFSLSAASLIGARSNCGPDAPAQCFEDTCECVYCLGPSNDGVNAPVNPLTCNGDWEITVAGFYWKAYEDGLEYAVETEVENTASERYRLVNADFKNPKFKGDLGFKLGLGYNTTCDGWDMGLLWTWYHGKASSHDEADEDTVSLLTLWSDQKAGIDPGVALFATDIQSNWKLELNFIDLELGRKFWNSPRVDLRPFIGLRIAYLDQDLRLEHKGGTWSDSQIQSINHVHIENDFHGVGIRAGMNSNWHFGCGWALYGDFALSPVYGKFSVDHNEDNRRTVDPFDKIKNLEAEDSFRTTSLFADVGLGISYTAILCDCDYALSVAFGWEQHLMMHQNQMWRVVPQEGSVDSDLNNIYHQRRGDLSTQGWTLKLVFDF
jgi:hypothetical protein